MKLRFANTAQPQWREPDGLRRSFEDGMDRPRRHRPGHSSLGATVTWFNPKTNKVLMRMNYELTCKPT
jgi:hypothetical protein